MKIRHIPKQFPTVHDFGFDNLIVGGCSFTYNNSDHAVCTWPYYLRDMGGFDQVYDFSMVGGGNTHTMRAIIFGVENLDIDFTKTLAIIQIAGNDRDDYIIGPDSLNRYPFVYRYADQAVVGITGGEGRGNFANPDPINQIKLMKNRQTRSIENAVNLIALRSYLEQKGIVSIFYEYRDYTLPGRDKNFDPRPYLPQPVAERYQALLAVSLPNFYKFVLKNDHLMVDDMHPSSDGHLTWTRECLVPFLEKYFNYRR